MVRTIWKGPSGCWQLHYSHQLLHNKLFCAGQSGKQYFPLLGSDLPEPAAFFPLTEGSGQTFASIDGKVQGALNSTG